MIKKTLIAIIISFAVFAFSFQIILWVTRRTCGHGSFDSMVQLQQLHYLVDIYRNDNNSLPDAEELNRIIEQHQKSPEEIIEPESSDKKYALFLISQSISENKNDWRWGSPPIYIQDKTLPEGYGFYLAGEDGISKSMGRDTDDVNSWDRKSFRFYGLRQAKQEALHRTYISIIPALLTFIYIITRKKKIFSSKRVSKA